MYARCARVCHFSGGDEWWPRDSYRINSVFVARTYEVAQKMPGLPRHLSSHFWGACDKHRINAIRTPRSSAGYRHTADSPENSWPELLGLSAASAQGQVYCSGPNTFYLLSKFKVIPRQRPTFEFWMLLVINTLYLFIYVYIYICIYIKRNMYIHIYIYILILYRLYIGPPELYCRRGSVCPRY